MSNQPRTYRIRLYRGDNERLPGRDTIAVLDFSPGPGLWATHGYLDGLVQALARNDGASGQKVLDYHLAVYDEATGVFRGDWQATRWLED